ncbi:MAG: hypothetical protein Q7U92_23650 [Bradyrhizobium sp.]|nr:hypothetical protein [Bradyrhizobium sp.]
MSRSASPHLPAGHRATRRLNGGRDTVWRAHPFSAACRASSIRDIAKVMIQQIEKNPMPTFRAAEFDTIKRRVM